MAQLYDANGNPFLTDVVQQAQNLGALAATNSVQLRGHATASVQVTGIGSLTLTFEGSTDGSNFDPILATPIAGGASVSTTTANGHWVNLNVAGLYIFRVRVSAYTSGSATVSVIASQGAAAPGYTATGAERVDIASVNGTALGTPTNFGTTPGAVVAESVNSSTFIGTTAAVAAAAGIQKVGISGNAGVALDAATSAAFPANALAFGVKTATANPANATAGNITAPMGDKAGRVVVIEGNVRENIGVQTTTIANSAAETTIVTAGAVGVFNDISHIDFTMTNAGTPAVCTITLKDATAGTTRAVYFIGATAAAFVDEIALNFPIPMPQAAAANNWTITLSSATVTVLVNVVYVKNL